MSFFDNAYKRNHEWTVETSTGTHVVKLKMGDSSRKPMSLYLDNRHVETITYNGISLIPQMEYRFSCEDETITLVLYGSKVDLVYNDIFVNKKINYSTDETISPVFKGIVLASVISSFFVFYILNFVFGEFALRTAYMIAALGILMCTLLSYYQMTSPFNSSKKKKISGLLMILMSWVIVIGVMMFFGYSGHWLKF